ncbi:MAG: hypothetical protein ACYC6R_04205 [Anaerolineales bacterium]
MSITAFRLVSPARRQANPVCRCRGWDVIPKRFQDANDVRWQIEELHPGTKQLTKTEKCPCHKGRSQRHHKAIAIMPGFS